MDNKTIIIEYVPYFFIEENHDILKVYTWKASTYYVGTLNSNKLLGICNHFKG